MSRLLTLPQSGEAFAVAADALARAWAWQLAGLARLAPSSLRKHLSEDPSIAFTDCSDAERVDWIASRDGAYTEHWSLAEAGEDDAVDERRIALPEGQVYRTSLALPKAARGRLASAVDLRMDEASPFPRDDLVYAFQRTKPGRSEDLNVDIAMTRASTLEWAEEAVGPWRRRLAIGARAGKA
ncbi:MAG: hypothetical protein AAGL49_03165, partial [Pseudomonadota bacterium]